MSARERNLDGTLALLREGYEFIPKRCRRYGTDVFETRLMLQPAICMTGADAARIFYGRRRRIGTRQGVPEGHSALSGASAKRRCGEEQRDDPRTGDHDEIGE